jgi:phage shock protein E
LLCKLSAIFYHVAMTMLVELNSKECSELIAGHIDLGIIDVRPELDFFKSRIPGAINIDIFDGNAIEALARLQKDRSYLVYCHSGVRSRSTIKIMHDLGFTSLFLLASGLASYQGPLDLSFLI